MFECIPYDRVGFELQGVKKNSLFGGENHSLGVHNRDFGLAAE